MAPGEESSSAAGGIRSSEAGPGEDDTPRHPAGAPSNLTSTDGTVPPTSVSQDVKSLVPGGSVEAAFTGAVKAPPVPRRRHFRPRLAPIRVPVRVHTFDSLAYRDFRFLWATTLFSAGGFWMQVVVLGWLTYDITRSAFLTSIAMGLDALPILLVGAFGGMLVDVLDRRKLLAVVLAYQTLMTLAFTAIVFLGLVNTWYVFGFIFLTGLSWVITDPARMSLIPSMVPRHNLVNAFALNSLAFSVTRLAVPAVGGVVLALLGPGPTLLVQAALQAAAFGMAFTIKAPPSKQVKLRFKSAYTGVLNGFRYAASNQTMTGLLLFAVLPSLLVMPFVHGLIPVYAAEVFRVGPAQLGMLMAAIGAGATVGMLVLASLGEIKYRGRLIVGAFVLTALAMLAFANNPSVALSFPNLMVVSIGVMVLMSTTNAAIQSIVSDEFRGRIAGLYMMTWGIMPVGSIAAGALAQRLGAPSATLIASGVAALALIAFIARFRAILSFR